MSTQDFARLAHGFRRLWTAMLTGRGAAICCKQLTQEVLALCPAGMSEVGWSVVVLDDAERGAAYAYTWQNLTPWQLADNLEKMIRDDVLCFGGPSPREVYERGMRQPQPVSGAWRLRKGARR